MACGKSVQHDGWWLVSVCVCFVGITFEQKTPPTICEYKTPYITITLFVMLPWCNLLVLRGHNTKLVADRDWNNCTSSVVSPFPYRHRRRTALQCNYVWSETFCAIFARVYCETYFVKGMNLLMVVLCESERERECVDVRQWSQSKKYYFGLFGVVIVCSCYVKVKENFAKEFRKYAIYKKSYNVLLYSFG